MCHRISQQHGTGTLFRVSLGTHAVGYILYANFSAGITVDYGGTALALQFWVEYEGYSQHVVLDISADE